MCLISKTGFSGKFPHDSCPFLTSLVRGRPFAPSGCGSLVTADTAAVFVGDDGGTAASEARACDGPSLVIPDFLLTVFLWHNIYERPPFAEDWTDVRAEIGRAHV